MNIDRSSWIVGSARPFLAALAILSVLSLATPSASANITLTYTASADASTNSTGSPATNSLITGAQTVGNFSYSIQAFTNDPAGGFTTNPGSSTLSQTTFTAVNHALTVDTLVISLTGAGYTLTGPLQANFSVSGSSSTHSAADQTIASSSINATAITTPAGTTITGTVTGVGSQPYSWNGVSSPLGNSNELFITPSGTFSESQVLTIKLGAGDSVTLTENTTAVAVPEPSSMAIAGLGALGLIGYGIRRRKGA